MPHNINIALIKGSPFQNQCNPFSHFNTIHLWRIPQNSQAGDKHWSLTVFDTHCNCRISTQHHKSHRTMPLTLTTYLHTALSLTISTKIENK